MCLHSTVDKSLIKPNKTLRTTIKAFLKKKVMEKETQRKKDEATKLAAITAATPITPAMPEAPTADSVELLDLQAQDGVNGNAITNGTNGMTSATGLSSTVPGTDTGNLTQQTTTDAQMDVPRPSIEVIRHACVNYIPRLTNIVDH